MRNSVAALLATALLAVPLAASAGGGKSNVDVVNPACVTKLTRLNAILSVFGLPQFDVRQTCTIKNK